MHFSDKHTSPNVQNNCHCHTTARGQYESRSNSSRKTKCYVVILVGFMAVFYYNSQSKLGQYIWQQITDNGTSKCTELQTQRAFDDFQSYFLYFFHRYLERYWVFVEPYVTCIFDHLSTLVRSFYHMYVCVRKYRASREIMNFYYYFYI